MDKPIVAHIVGEYMFPYQSYIYRQLLGHIDFKIVVVSKLLVKGSRQKFPFKDLYYLTLLGRLYGLANRLDEGIFDFLLVLYLKVLIKLKKIKLLHIHSGAFGARLASYFRFWGIPVVVSFYGSDVFSYPLKSGWDKKYKKMFASQAHFIPLCESMRGELINLGAKPENNHVVHVVVDTDDFPFQERKVSDRVRFITVARLVEKKGHFILLEAFKKLVDSGLPVELEIVGFGELREKILKRVQELGLAGRVTLTDPSGVGDYFSFLKGKLLEAHIFVLSSIVAKNADREGTPVTIMEAMATGLPVIASNLSGIPEVVEEGKTGFLVPQKDVQALAEKMEFLAINPQLWSEMGRAGRRRIEKEFSQKHLPKGLGIVYNQILK